jgi:hypothetical protein
VRIVDCQLRGHRLLMVPVSGVPVDNFTDLNIELETQNNVRYNEPPVEQARLEDMPELRRDTHSDHR